MSKLGSFVWCELMTTDTAGAESFYQKVVGWNPKPFSPDGSYTVFNTPAGSGSAGLMLLPDDAKKMGVPPHWLMYVGTPNVDSTALRIAQLGGKVLKQPTDIPNTGRFAVVQDPFGAAFGIYASNNPQPPKDEPGIGDFSWFELYTPNPEGAWNFYQSLFGWEKTSAMDMGEMGVYQMFGRGNGVPNGGIMKPPPGAPAAWQPYVRVKDAKGAAALATASGGKVINGPMEVPGGDWIFQGIDPQGAMFAVHSLKSAAAKAAPASAKPPASKPAKRSAPAKKAAPKKKAAAKKAAKKRTKPAKAAKRAKPATKSAKKAKKAAKKAAKKTARTAAKRKK